MAYSALEPVANAVIVLLNVAGLTNLATLTGDPAQGGSLPFVWPELSEREMRGFGTGSLPELELRVHTFSRYEGMKEAQQINAKVIELLRDKDLTITGWNHCGKIFYDETVLLPMEEVNGRKVCELVSMFRIYAEEQ